MKKITLILITLLMLTCFSSAANYDLKETIGGVSVITTIPEGTNVTLKYIKNGNFTKWEVKQGGITLSDATNKTVTFTMPARDVEIEAIEMTESATQPLTTCTDGQIRETTQMNVGESVTLTPVEGNGRTFSSWEITGLTGANATANPLTFTMPNNAVEIIATFIVHTHSYSEATCTTPPTCSCGATEGAALGHSWTAATCTTAKTCSACSATEGSALGHSYTGTRTCNINGSTDKVQCANCSSTESQTCTHTYTISKSAGTGGSITLSATSVKAGGSATATITPSSGYEIDSIQVNGSSKSVSNKAGMTYTFSSVKANQTITVTFSKKAIIANSNVAVGAYITYTPDKTIATVSTTDSGYIYTQHFIPQSTTSWRVMYNNNGQLDIVSSDAVYGAGETGVRLYGKTGYAKAVNTLNNLCSQYVNPTYATSGRHIGCTSASVATINEANICYGVTGSPYIDQLYITDVNQIKNNGLGHTEGFTWLASRDGYIHSDEGYAEYGIRMIYPKGDDRAFRLNLFQEYYEGYTEEGWDEGVEEEDLVRMGIRPVVSLKSTIAIVGGSGTSADPYIIQ